MIEVAAKGNESVNRNNTFKIVQSLQNNLNVITGDIDMMRLLIENGANINAVNNSNQSALITAIAKGIFFLLNKSCDIRT